MSLQLNFKMITIAREARGLTQSQLARLIPKLAQGNLSKIEKGILNATEEHINKISAALKFPISFFYEQYQFPVISDVYYRKLVTTSVRKMSELDAICKIVAFLIDNMLESVEIPEFEIPVFDLCELNLSPAEAARRTRYKLGISDGRIDDIADIIEKNGVIIIEIDTEIEKYSGMSIRTSKGAVIMFLNANMPNDRKRLTIAHELGHIVMHINNIYRDERRDIEKEAFAFAGEFLMPYKDFRKDIINTISYSRLDLLKSYWMTSKQAILFKAREDKLITPEKYKSLMVQLSMNGERKFERGDVYFQEPKLLKKILNVFYDDFSYSKDELTDAIMVDIDTLPLVVTKKTAQVFTLKHRINL